MRARVVRAGDRSSRRSCAARRVRAVGAAQPHIGYVYPAGGRAGTTFEVAGRRPESPRRRRRLRLRRRRARRRSSVHGTRR